MRLVPEGEELMLTKAEEDAELELEPGLAGASSATPPPAPPEAEAGNRRGGSWGPNVAVESDSPSALRSSTSSRSADAVLAKPCSVRNAMTSSKPGAAMCGGGVWRRAATDGFVLKRVAGAVR